MESKPKYEAKPLAELAPYLTGLISARDIQFLTEKMKQSRATETCTTRKPRRPFTPAEMQLIIEASKRTNQQTPARNAASTRKKNWNSSVKVVKSEKRVMCVSENGKIKNTSVRKVLNFQPKPKVVTYPRNTISSTQEMPHFQSQKSEVSTLKTSVHIPAIPTIQINGINRIPETPETLKENNKPMTSKGNDLCHTNLLKKSLITPKSILRKRVIPDTPQSNISLKSSDGSFLQIEKEINDKAEKELSEQKEFNMTNETPPASTPFKEYRNVQTFFNDTADSDSLYNNDNTILNFSDSNKNGKQNERLLKSTVTNTDTLKSDLTVRKQELERRNAELDIFIEKTKRRKEYLLRELQELQELIDKQYNNNSCSENKIKRPFKEYRNDQKVCNDTTDLADSDSLYNNNNTILNFSNSNKNGKQNESDIVSLCDLLHKITVSNTETVQSDLTERKQELERHNAELDILIEEAKRHKEYILRELQEIIEKQYVNDSCTENKIKRRSVTKSLSYKIPKKLSISKKAIHKSSNVAATRSPEVKHCEALNMYMDMKKNLNFLSTPRVEHRNNDITDTPARMSKNLQLQLGKLYNNN